MTDAEIAVLIPRYIERPLAFRAGRIEQLYPAGTPLMVKDVLMLRLILENWDKRAVFWSITAGGQNWLGLGDRMIQQGLALRLMADRAPDPSRLARGLWEGLMVDLPRTDSLVTVIYQYSSLFDHDTLDLDPTSTGILYNLANPHWAAGMAWLDRGDSERARHFLERSQRLAPSEQVGMILQQLRSGVDLFRDLPPVDTLGGNQP
jgi:hypothetical protein